MGQIDVGGDDSNKPKASKVVRPNERESFNFFKSEIVKFKEEKEKELILLSQGNPMFYKAIKYGDVETYLAMILNHAGQEQ